MREGMWRHRNCTEIDFELVRKLYGFPAYEVWMVRYWRRDFGSGGYLMEEWPEQVLIKKEQKENWSYLG